MYKKIIYNSYMCVYNIFFKSYAWQQKQKQNLKNEENENEDMVCMCICS